MAEVVIFGAAGYSGLELIRRLAAHPHAQLVGASSDRYAETPVASLVANFPGELTFQPHVKVLAETKAGQLAFLATPAQTAAELAPTLLERGLKVVDLSGGHRLAPELFPQWYGFEHPHPDTLAKAQYGLPELLPLSQSEQVEIVANPGCYATASILAVGPLLKAGLLKEGAPIILDGKSGVTGAGRALKDNLLFNEVAESVRPYKVAGHQHTPEIEMALQRLAGKNDCAPVLFTAHLIPMRRGLIVSAYLQVKAETTSESIQEAFQDSFKETPLVRFLGETPPETGRQSHTNTASVSATLDPRTQTVAAFAAIDNLGKGAAGQAIQNFNALFNYPATAGLL